MDFIANEEGCILHPYKDSVGVWTIGIGCTYYSNGNKVQGTDAPINKEYALLLFAALLRHYELAVWANTRDDIKQSQFDALVSLCYNIGVTAFKGSTVLERVNENPDGLDIGAAFLMWKNAGGLPSLLGRRKREAALYFKK